MWKDVNTYVKGCVIYQKHKYDRYPYPGLLQPLNLPTIACISISMNFIEGLPKSKGKTVIWVLVDRLTKYAHFLGLSHPYLATDVATDVAKLFME